MRSRASVRAVAALVAALGGAVCGGGAQESELVVSSDPELQALAASLLPDLARRSGLELREPVRLERRSREELVRYLTAKLDEELPPEEAEATVTAYALLGMVPDTLDLRGMLLSVYTEQVAGFYEPDSAALFVMDDQPAAALEPLLVHELVHAVQDQSADLDALTDPARGNDASVAAQAAIEGHATLVMLEYLGERAQGSPVDLARIPDFARSIRPALEAVRSQYPALAGAPRVIQESLLFPYLEGTGFVQDLWVRNQRAAPFGAFLPRSTEQVMTHDRADVPVDVELEVGAEVVHRDDLGMLELGIFLEELAGEEAVGAAEGWGGDRYVLVRAPDGDTGLVLAVVWDTPQARDRFVGTVRGGMSRLHPPASVTAVESGAGPAAVLRVGVPLDVSVEIRRRAGP